ncbi:hypothetical protein MKS88_001799 [Plasmodium brasilianum]|uniref:Uncharacterized protein n=1 Tax=Plasmodium brasilianum TaxID=5824 RepID=A0ACB9YCS1_PLABR|nr:hypothetical protein MKS88_001799 [Plasmodium brasilianum]
MLFFINNIKSNFCKYLDEKNINDEKLYIRTYRLLSKNKKEKCSNIIWKKVDIPNNGEYENKHVYKNGGVSKGKSNLQKEYISNSSGGYNHVGKCKSSDYNKININYGKRILDKIYYKNLVRYSKNADFKFITKCIQ